MLLFNIISKNKIKNTLFAKVRLFECSFDSLIVLVKFKVVISIFDGLIYYFLLFFQYFQYNREAIK